MNKNMDDENKSVNENFIYEDFTAVDEGIAKAERRQIYLDWKTKAFIFSRYAKYVFIGVIVFGVLAIMLSYAWHLLKEERVVVQEKIIVKEIPISNNNPANSTRVIDGKNVSVISNVTHFTHVYDQRVGSNKYDIITRWKYDSASDAQIGKFPDEQTCYANFKRNAMEVRLELYKLKNGIAQKQFSNSELKKYSVPKSDAENMKKYCQWYI